MEVMRTEPADGWRWGVSAEDTRRATKEEGNLVTKGAHPNWVNARELGSLGNNSKDSFLNSPKDRTS